MDIVLLCVSVSLSLSLSLQQQAVEGVDGGESGDVTSEQGPGSPSLPPGSGGKMEEREGGGGETVQQATALEAVEQQMVLIHDEYKKLLRDKEVLYTTLYHISYIIMQHVVYLCVSYMQPCCRTSYFS